MNTDRYSTFDQDGSVLSEFIVVSAVVLVPLAILMPILFKYIENRQYVEQASRYAAWEKTAYYHRSAGHHVSNAPVKNETEIRREIDNRIFSDGFSRIHRLQKESDHTEEINPNLTVWNRSSSEATPIFDSVAQDSSTTQWSDVAVVDEGIGGGLSNAFTQFTVALLTVGTPAVYLEDKGLYTSNVNVDLAAIDYFPELGDVPLYSRSATLLADGWTQGGPSQAASAARSLNVLGRWGDGTITNVINKVGDVLSIVPLPGFNAIGSLEMGKVEVDAVPCVNLGVLQNDGSVSPATACH